MKKYLFILILFTTSFVNGQNKDILFLIDDDAVPVTPADTVPSSFNFTDLANVNFSTELTSDSIIVADFDSASISISAGSYRQGALGSWETAQSMAYSGDTIWIKNTSSANCTTAVNTTLTIGGVTNVWSITTKIDTTPTAFAFTDRTSALLSTEYVSDSVVVAGIVCDATISIDGGSYKIGVLGSYVSSLGIVSLGDTIWLKNTSSSSCTTAVNSILTIGGVSDTYSITTVADTVPTSFSFTDKTNAALSTEYTSDSIVVGGIACDASISVSGGTYRKGALGSFTATQGTVSNGDTIWVKNTSSGSPSTAVHCTLTVGGVNDIYSITTVSTTYDSSISTPLASSDDGFYKAAYTDITGTKLIIGGSTGACSFAVRFRNITIPNGATIDSARLYLYGAGEYSVTTVTMRIYGEDVDSVGVFIGDDAGADFNTRDNTLTTAYVADTNVPTWSTNTLYTYVVTSIVSELVATRNYTNEAMGIFVIDQGSGATANRRCWSYDNGSLYPTLKIYFHY